MKYQPLNDLIDPDVAPDEGIDPEVEPEDPRASANAYVIGDREKQVEALLERSAKAVSKGQKPWVKPAAVLLAVACLGLTGWNLSRVAAGPPAPLPPSPFQIKQALYLGVMRIEAFRRVHGLTPETAEESGLSNPPYSYQRLSPTQYAVGFETAGSKIEYDSSVPMEQFFGSPKAMLTMGGSE